MLFQNELLNLFDSMEDSMFSAMNVPDIMRTDVYEYEGKLMLEIELPGYEQNEIHAQLKDGCLTIMASRPTYIEEEMNRRNYSRRERYCGSCKRSYYISAEVHQEDISAVYKNGILYVLIELPQERLCDLQKFIEIN